MRSHKGLDLLKPFRAAILVTAALVFYILFHHLTGYGIPCLFHRITGLRCPGCGITRMLSSLMVLDFKAARAANPFLFVTGPFVLFEIVYEYFFRKRKERFFWQDSFEKVNNILIGCYISALIVFGVLRNLDAVLF